MKFKSTLKLLAYTLLATTLFVPLVQTPAYALSGKDFNPANIIDDSLFYRGPSMSASSVQKFLNSKVPKCDTNGKKQHWSGVSRAERGRQYDNPPPFTCLKDFKQNTPKKSKESGLCNAISAKSNRTAAQILHDVSKACGIDVKVLIVMLQKEQSLITDDWPWDNQYEKAMGYYCPDDPDRPGWCHPDYAGFFNQVYNAARQLKNYRKNPQKFNFAVNRRSKVYFQANNTSCGYTWITMQNAATAALYNYTPYQPNKAALNNLYGEGDKCSAYGNRNFWRLYNDWFGSTQGNIRGAIYRLYNKSTNNHLYTTSASERDNAAKNLGFGKEGTAFMACTNGSGQPIYRLYNPKNGRHFYTPSARERDRAAKNTNFRKEDSKFSACGSKPVYRLYSKKEEKHFYTTSKSERDSLVKNTTFVYEGISFRVD